MPGKNMDLAIGYPSFAGTFDSFIRSFIVLPAGIPGILTWMPPYMIKSSLPMPEKMRLLLPEIWSPPMMEIRSFRD
jgi:hypothetical protein